MGEAGRRVARLGSAAGRPEDLPSPQRHTFRVPPNPKAGFDGIVVRCQVLECEPPSRLAYSRSAGPIIDTQVIYRLEPDGDGTRVFFEHSTMIVFDIAAFGVACQPRCKQKPTIGPAPALLPQETAA